ncbi:MAG: hypothetical protein ACREL7_11060 [Longimicrobiales bacterium]
MTRLQLGGGSAAGCEPRLPWNVLTYRGGSIAEYAGGRATVKGDEPAPGATELGDYELTPGATVQVFLFDEKPYIHMPGIGDVQMFPAARDTFTFRVLPGVLITFERGAEDEVTAVTLTLGDKKLKAART